MQNDRLKLIPSITDIKHALPEISIIAAMLIVAMLIWAVIA